MKKFILSFSLFITFLFVFVGILGSNYYCPVEKSDYMAAIIDKHELLDRTYSPRLILVGGSNLAFGIDSRMIEDSIGLPVINLGLHGGLGLNFMLNEIKLSAKPKDIIIISIEYFLLTEGVYGLQRYTANFYPDANNYFQHNYYHDLEAYFYEVLNTNFKNNIYHILGLQINKKILTDTNSIYARGSFNVYGDVIRHLNRPRPVTFGGKSIFTYKKWEGIELLNSFAEFAKTNSIKVYFLFPNYPESEFIVNKDVIMKYEKDLKNELKIEILNKPEDLVFPDSLVYDYVYHLTKLGREKRTKLLIQTLKQII
jgi:hypothetical protein